MDTRGFSCPLPILKLKRAVDEMESGQILKMLATDPGSVLDVEAWCEKTGNPLLESSQEGSAYIFWLRKK